MFLKMHIAGPPRPTESHSRGGFRRLHLNQVPQSNNPHYNVRTMVFDIPFHRAPAGACILGPISVALGAWPAFLCVLQGSISGGRVGLQQNYGSPGNLAEVLRPVPPGPTDLRNVVWSAAVSPASMKWNMHTSCSCSVSLRSYQQGVPAGGLAPCTCNCDSGCKLGSQQFSTLMLYMALQSALQMEWVANM